jgi:hypothetical protein
MMRPFAILAAALLACACNAQAQPDGLTNGPIQVQSAPVPLKAKGPGLTGLGHFSYAGGIVLTSPDSHDLGGLSDLQIDPDGSLIAVTDEGDLFRAHVDLDGRGYLSGLSQASLRPLLGVDGKPLASKPFRDAEGVVKWPNGDLMISFERHHRIWIHPADGSPPVPAPMPDVAMDDNVGMEGLSLAPSQGPDAYWVGLEPGSVWLCRLKGSCLLQDQIPKPDFGYRLSSLREAPNGDLVLVHHSFASLTGSLIRVSILADPAGASPRRVDGFKLSKPLATENYEGVWVSRLSDGRYRLYLLADDNFRSDQVNLFTAFDWKPR